MITKEINELRDVLETQIIKHKPFNEIYSTSVKIDKLITKYYKEKELLKQLQKI